MKKLYLSFLFIIFIGKAYSQSLGSGDWERALAVSDYLDHAEDQISSPARCKTVSEPSKKIPSPSISKERPLKGDPLVKAHSIFSDTDTKIDAGPESVVLHGETKYRIEFIEQLDDFGGIEVPGASELNFPIRGMFAGARVNWQEKLKSNSRHDLVRVTLDVYTHVYNAKAYMRDSDWFDDPFHSGRDIYSESRSDMGGYAAEGRFVFNVFSIGENIFTGPMLGFKYQHLKFSCRDLSQIGYDVFDPYFTMDNSGPSLEYEVKHMVPYLGWSADIIFADNLTFQAAGGYSFYTQSQDIDDHVLRYKRSTGDCTGHAILADGALSWDMDDSWRFTTFVQYMRTSASGRQIQRFYDGPYAGVFNNIDMQIKSSQLEAMVSWAYKF